MCGIAGFVETHASSRTQLESRALELASALKHRGPDDSGVWTDADLGLALAHARLAIIDVSDAGHQPMVSADDRWVLVYNGELYNSDELRRGCRLGRAFRGHSDTELLVELIAQDGVRGATQKLNGMFAFAAWDRQRRELWLVRDRLGEKPLYFGVQNSTLMFASELKALRRHPDFRSEVDRDSLATYFSYNCVRGARSIYSGISRLLPGHMLCLRAAEDFRIHESEPYWSAINVAEQAIAARGNPITSGDLNALIADAVARRMVSDVPLGALLSGGIDSSVVVALMQACSDRAVHTFTIGFEETAFDEAPYARAIAKHLGTDHTELYVQPREALDVIPLLPSIYDEPFADASQIPTFIVSQLAQRSVKVALTGDGGDELFAGYNRHLVWARLWSASRALPGPLRLAVASAIRRPSPRSWDLLSRVARRIAPASIVGDGRLGERVLKAAEVLESSRAQEAYDRLAAMWQPSARLVLNGSGQIDAPGSPTVTPSFTEEMMLLDLVGYLPDDILVKVDRASMAASLEVRAPFLDHRVVDAAWRIPVAEKIQRGRGKVPLRSLLAQYVPVELFDRPKAGFAVPVGAWLRGPLRAWASDLLDPVRVRREGYLDAETVGHIWREHLTGRRDWPDQLWGVLMFQAWLERESTRAL